MIDAIQSSSKLVRKMTTTILLNTSKTPATDALERSFKRRRLSVSSSDDSSLSSSASSSSSEENQFISMDALFRSIIDFPVIEWDSGELMEGSAGNNYFAIVG